MSDFDIESIKNKAIEQSLFGQGWRICPLLESILNAALEGEMDAYLNDEERLSGNRCNGKMQNKSRLLWASIHCALPAVSLKRVGYPSILEMYIRLH